MQVKDSRTSNITKNAFVVLATQVVNLLFAFANRTLFIKFLGESFLGLDGLFTSILTIFTLAELGIGNALIFSLYKPLATGDTKKAQQLLHLYDVSYRWIIGVVLVVGLVLIPFLKAIVNVDLSELGINIYVVYVLFLLNTTSSYFLAFRQAILVVNQKQRVVSLYQTMIKILVCSLECIVLIFSKSYYIYLLIRVVGNYICAIWISRKAKTEYPELCIVNKEPLPKEETQRIKKDVFALFIRRVGGVVLSSTDNIIINSYISLAMVGVYSNYVLIVTSIQGITAQVLSSMTASIGNFVATNTKSEVHNAFKLYSMITYLVYGFCSICFIMLINPFIELLWGTDFLLSRTALFLIVMNFFFYGFQTAINTFRDTTGLFVQGKYRSLASASVNLLSSLVLVQYLGIEGVILGTIVSRVFVSAWYDPYILYKNIFKQRPVKYFVRFVEYFLCTFVSAYTINTFVVFGELNWFTFILLALVAVLASFILILPFIRTKEFLDLKHRLTAILLK